MELTKGQSHVAYYHDMGLGKTFTGSEKLYRLGKPLNLVVCQKSKVNDWINHFITNYPQFKVFDLTGKPAVLQDFMVASGEEPHVGVINYDLVWRRKEFLKMTDFTMVLDESSLIQNEQAKRTKFILKLLPANVILLSGTPTGGKYERLWSQLHLLGWKISKKLFYNQYVDYTWDDSNGFPLMIINGYKNEERLKQKMRDHGCNFLKTDEVFDLPEQIHQTVEILTTKEYRKFRNADIVTISQDPEITLVGDTVLTKMLYERFLCGQYNSFKTEAMADMIESTDDRLIIFYNFKAELDIINKICISANRPVSMVNGSCKDLLAYENFHNSITLVQYQAGAMGLNLQKANKMIFFTPPLSSELFEQAKKRIHRIGQNKTCFYYYLTCKNSIEEKIYRTLAKRKDFTEALFEKGGDEIV